MKLNIQNLLPIVLLVIFSMISQIIFINPLVLSDQMQYFKSAVIFPDLLNQPTHWSLRIGLIIPVSILFRLFGYSELTYYIVPIISMTFLVLMIYFIGKELFNKKIGFISALWLTFLPNFLLESGHLLPDIPATTSITACIYILIIIKTRFLKSKKPQKSKTISFLFALSGALFGWSYLLKEYFLFFFILIPIFFWVFKIPFRFMIAFLAGALFLVSIEFLLGIYYYKDPFIRLHAARPRETWGYIERDVGVIVSYLPVLLSQYGSTISTSLCLFAFFGSIVHAWKKNKTFIFLFSWMLLTYGLFTGLGLLPIILGWEEKVLLRAHIFRYWVPILPPLIISGIALIEAGISSFFCRIKLDKQRIGLATNSLLMLILFFSAFQGIINIKDNPDLIRNGSDHYLELREYLISNKNPTGAVWVIRDRRIAYDHLFPIYTHNFWGKKIWTGKIKYLNEGKSYMHLEEIPTGYVIVDREYYISEFNPVPDYLDSPPESWQIAFESENKKIALYSIE